ncbi:unnamed protein product, partial [Symbiodinium microadriaticum]
YRTGAAGAESTELRGPPRIWRACDLDTAPRRGDGRAGKGGGARGRWPRPGWLWSRRVRWGIGSGCGAAPLCSPQPLQCCSTGNAGPGLRAHPSQWEPGSNRCPWPWR